MEFPLAKSIHYHYHHYHHYHHYQSYFCLIVTVTTDIAILISSAHQSANITDSHHKGIRGVEETLSHELRSAIRDKDITLHLEMNTE